MAKKKFLYVIGLIAALCIGFVIGISVNYPRPESSGLAGTFGKAEKYRKVQMTEKDVQLRSELLKDTARLKTMIQGLVYFSVFTEDVSSQIDAAIVTFQVKGMGKQADEAEKIKALQEYSGFIRNNNKTLNTTIAMLTGFYLNDTIGKWLDVEKNLRDFGTYVSQLSEKNEMLKDAIISMDNFMIASKTLQAQSEEIRQLKSVRDQLLIKGIEVGGLVNSRDQVNGLVYYAMESQGNLAVYLGQEKPSASEILSREDLKVTMARDNDLSFIDMVAAVTTIGNSGSDLKVYCYDKANLQFAQGKPDLNFVVGNHSDIQLVIYAGKGDLNVVAHNYNLQDVVSAQVMNVFLDATQLNTILALDNLQTIILSTGGLNIVSDILSGAQLGIFFD